jgi:outer membrane protein TolC
MVEVVKQRVEQGASTQIQLNLATVSLARAEQEMENIELAHSAAVRSLIGLMGVMPDGNVKLQEDRAAGWPDDDARIPDARDMSARALDNRPKLKAAAARFDGLSHAVNAERAKRWPWIQRVVLPRYRHREYYYSNDTNDFSVKFDVSVPIFNQNSGKIAAAEAARDREHDALVAAVETLRRDIALACAELQDRKTALLRFRDVIMPAIEEGEVMLERANQGGQVDISAVLAGQDATFRIRREYVDARLQYRRAWLALARIVGAPPSTLLRSKP